MKRSTAINPLSVSMGDSTLSFEFVPLASANAIGLVRSITTRNLGLIEQDLVFKSREEFLRWVDEDEFRHRAPRLFFAVCRAFDALLNSKARHDAHLS